MNNIYKNFIINLNKEKEVTFDSIRNYTKDLVDILDLENYIINVIETNDKNVIAQYDHDRKIIEYNINKINAYSMKNNSNKQLREQLFNNIIMNLQTIRHEIRHAEQNQNYYEILNNIERLIYIDSLSSAYIYENMHDLCPVEVDADFEGIMEIDKFFKQTNYLNGELSKLNALNYVKKSLLSLYKNEQGTTISPALIYYRALKKERRYHMLKASIKSNEQKLRYGFSINDNLLNEIKIADDIKKIIKKV